MSVQIYVFCAHAFPWYMESEILPYMCIYTYTWARMSSWIMLGTGPGALEQTWNKAYNKLGTFWEQAWIMSEQAWNMLLRRWTCLEWACSKLDIGWGAYGHPSDGIQPIPWAPGGPHVIFFLLCKGGPHTVIAAWKLPNRMARMQKLVLLSKHMWAKRSH